MIDQIEQLKKKLEQVLEDDEILDLTKNFEGLKEALSNANLLATELTKFYKEKKSSYFPRYITGQINSYISDADAQINSLLTKKTDQNAKLHGNLDKLYALCLQSGIISFGFDNKELVKILDDSRRNIQHLDGEVKALEENIEDNENKVTDLLQSWQKQINDFLQSEKKKIADKSDNTVIEIDRQSQEFQKNMKSSFEIINSNITKSNELNEKVIRNEQSINEKNENIEKLLNSANQILADLKKNQQESSAILNAIESENNNAQNLVNQIQNKFDNAGQIASQITAKNNTADETLAAIQERKKDADEFYTTVEDYKKAMLDTNKKATADYSKLKETCDKTISEYNSKTEEIVKQNTEYQEQIKDLLAKAVSGGLFKVFNQRQEFLSKGTIFWKWAVVITSILLAAGILFIAWICEAKPDIIFFVRLAIMIPLAFLMFFAATQYKKERQAEEEYAFKSAISLSLEPYRDLLVRMRKEDELEAEFVQKLMEDVFDNPVMRLFNIEEGEEKIAKIIINFLKKLPKDKSGAIIEQVSKKILE